MSLLTIVTEFNKRIGFPAPSTVVGNTDTQVAQVLALLQEECQILAQRGSWAGLTNECTFLSLAAESQGTLASLGSGPSTTNGLRYILNESFWDRTARLPIKGPVDTGTWQARKASGITGPYYEYRLRGVTTDGQAELLFNPTPAAGHTIAFEYVTNNWCLSASTVVSNVFVADADTILLPESIVTLGLRWRYKKEKGFTYAEDFNDYERMVVNGLGRDGTKRRLSMEADQRQFQPGILVPAGSWPL